MGWRRGGQFVGVRSLLPQGRSWRSDLAWGLRFGYRHLCLVSHLAGLVACYLKSPWLHLALICPGACHLIFLSCLAGTGLESWCNLFVVAAVFVFGGILHPSTGDWTQDPFACESHAVLRSYAPGPTDVAIPSEILNRSQANSWLHMFSIKGTTQKLGVLTHRQEPSTQEAKAGKSPWAGSQPELHSEFQASLAYRDLFTKQNKTQHNTTQQNTTQHNSEGKGWSEARPLSLQVGALPS